MYWLFSNTFSFDWSFTLGLTRTWFVMYCGHFAFLHLRSVLTAMAIPRHRDTHIFVVKMQYTICFGWSVVRSSAFHHISFVNFEHIFANTVSSIFCDIKDTPTAKFGEKSNSESCAHIVQSWCHDISSCYYKCSINQSYKYHCERIKMYANEIIPKICFQNTRCRF